MKLGIIGLPQAGKTTVFNALTGGDRPVTMSGGRFEVHTAVVSVPDWRLDQLVKLFHPKKITRAKVTYADIAGLEGEPRSSGLAGQLLNQLAQMDGFVHVLRGFEAEDVPHPGGRIDPQRDLDALNAELLLNDLILVERRLERLSEELRRNASRDKVQLEREKELFNRLQVVLNDEIPLRDLDLDAEAERIISGFGFLTRKPMLVLLNLGEGQTCPDIAMGGAKTAVANLQGKLEMEIAQLDPEEAQEFLKEYQIAEPGLSRIIRLSYDLLGLQSFFTVGEDEVRAWTVQRYSSAIDAAGAIHSDLQKGFIRAEVIPWTELVELGGLPEARSRGRLRLEGKEYRLQDGEIMHVRFNV